MEIKFDDSLALSTELGFSSKGKKLSQKVVILLKFSPFSPKNAEILLKSSQILDENNCPNF